SGKRAWKEFSTDFRHFHGALNGKANSLRKDEWKRNLTAYLPLDFFHIRSFQALSPLKINSIQCEEIGLKK
ncbi:MAG TPA: hypothetical protein DD384_04400, partial [Firmicutes bacterium]|nr:hypothetical protein [Bacillota bacterium]